MLDAGCRCTILKAPMNRKIQVMRNGIVIGCYDEVTLAALINAGELRLSDTYWQQGMGSPRSLAEWLGQRRSPRPWPRVALCIGILGALVAGLFGWNHKSAMPASIEPEHALSSQLKTAAPPYEVRRGEATFTGSFDASSDDAPRFPSPAIETLVAHSRVAVLTLDEAMRPRSISSGFVIGDGSRVMCSLTALQGASTVEVRHADGRVERPKRLLWKPDVPAALLVLENKAVPLRIAAQSLSNYEKVFIPGHALSSRQQGWVANVRGQRQRESVLVYQLDHQMPPPAAGSAVVNATGDVAAIVVDAAHGVALRASDVMASLKKTPPQDLSSLGTSTSNPLLPSVEVATTKVSEGSLIASLRNTSGLPIHAALLHVTYFPTPPEADEEQELEARLRKLAVEASEFEDPTSDTARANRQALREVNTRLEEVQKRLRTAVESAVQRPARQDFHIVQCELPPGIPQTVALDVNAGTQWSARVIVLDVDS